MSDDQFHFSANEPTAEEVAGVAPNLSEQVEAALEDETFGVITEFVKDLHPADIADMIDGLGPDSRVSFLDRFGHDLQADVLSFIDSELRDEVAEHLGAKAIANYMKSMESDDALEFFEDLREDLREKILARVPHTIRRILQTGLEYPDDSAGRLMQREVVVVPAIWTVGDTIDYMRNNRKRLQEDFYDLYIVDPRYKPIGKLPLNRVLRHKRHVSVLEIMEEDFYPIPGNMDQEEVAHLFKQYQLLSVPVIDEPGRLVGVITLDDVLHVVEEEAEDDLLKLSGVKSASVYSAAWKTARSRVGWLFVNLFTAFLASAVIGVFEATLEQIVALAILMPIVSGIGGNAGTQSLTVAVRGLAMRDLQGGAARRFLVREVMVGLVNGVCLAAVVGTVSSLWFGEPLIGVVMASALIINMIWAGLLGSTIPLTLDKLGIDPAVASSVFLTALTDTVGFLSFLGLATLVLL